MTSLMYFLFLFLFVFLKPVTKIQDNFGAFEIVALNYFVPFRKEISKKIEVALIFKIKIQSRALLIHGHMYYVATRQDVVFRSF